MSRKRGVQVCAQCGEHVRWAKTVNGKAIQLNFSSDDDGNQVFVGRGEVMQLAGPELERERHAGTVLFKVHRSDCSAGQHVSGRMPDNVRAMLQQRSHGSPARRTRG